MVKSFVDLFDIALEPDSLAYFDEVLLAHLAPELRIVRKEDKKARHPAAPDSAMPFP